MASSRKPAPRNDPSARLTDKVAQALQGGAAFVVSGHGAPVIAGMLGGEIQQWFESKVAVIEQWITDGRIKPVDPRHLFFIIWAATQHYADFDVQVALLLQHPTVEAQDYAKAAETITGMVFGLLGIEAPPR